MKRFGAFLVMACMMMAGTACGDSDKKQDDPVVDPQSECTASIDWKKCIDATAYNQCIGGVASQGNCMADEICQNNECIKKGTPEPEPCAPDGVVCQGTELVTCVGGTLTRVTCNDGCIDGACIVPVENECSPDGVKCDGNVLVTCTDGKETRKPCDNGCENNACIVIEEKQCLPDGVKCEGKELVTCTGGKETRTPCDNGCVDGACFVPTAGCSPDGAKCEDNVLVLCAGGIESRQTCVNGCENNTCVESVKCSPDGVKCEGNDLVTCAGGIETRKTCQAGCKNNACVSKCGNGVREGDEICDGDDIGELTCRNLPNVMQTANYKGKPACNDTCDGLENGTCEKVFCGNNQLDLNNDIQEFCDIVDGESKFRDSVSCSDIKGYEGKEWQEGGKPGCPADCSNNLKFGTCKLAAQPQGGIETCHFDEFKNDEENKEVSGHVVIHAVEGVTTGLVSGKFVCGNPAVETYTWQGNSARFQECEDCEATEFRMVSEVSYASKAAGTYGCVFQVHINTESIDGNSSNTFYNCPVTPGYPYDLKILPDETVMHTFEVAGEAVEGTVLAHWDFHGYVKDDTGKPENFVKSVSADDGVMKGSSKIKLSDNSGMRMLSGTGDFPEAAVSSNDWSQSDTLDMDAKHFVIQSSSKGYKNVRFKFMVAGSGETDVKHIVTVYRANGSPEVVGKELVFDGKNQYQQYPVTMLEKATDLDSFELDVYTYASTGTNMTIRLDDIYIIGDPVE